MRLSIWHDLTRILNGQNDNSHGQNVVVPKFEKRQNLPSFGFHTVPAAGTRLHTFRSPAAGPSPRHEVVLWHDVPRHPHKRVRWWNINVRVFVERAVGSLCGFCSRLLRKWLRLVFCLLGRIVCCFHKLSNFRVRPVGALTALAGHFIISTYRFWMLAQAELSNRSGRRIHYGSPAIQLNIKARFEPPCKTAVLPGGWGQR
jgi:hypothetical protein